MATTFTREYQGLQVPQPVKDAAVANLAVGYSVTYLFGSAGVTWFLSQMAPKLDAQNRVRWFCRAGEDLSARVLPRHCQGDER